MTKKMHKLSTIFMYGQITEVIHRRIARDLSNLSERYKERVNQVQPVLILERFDRIE